MATVATAIGAILAAGGIGAALLRTAFSLLLNYAISKLFPPKGPTPQDVQSEIRQSNAPRLRHYGRVRTAGVVMFWDWTTVGGKRWLYKLLAVSTGGIESFDRYWLNETEVTLDGYAVQTEPWNGPVEIWTRRGRPDVNERQGGWLWALNYAFPDNWILGIHRLEGVATILGRFRAVKGENISDVYPGGEPKMTALIKGCRVYDPRLGTKSAATIGFSENVALQILDLLTGDFGRIALADIDLNAFIAAANDCDDAVPLKTGGTAPRYYGGGSYQLNEPLKDVLRRMLDACGGQLYRTGGGQIGLRVGKWRGPNYTITEDKIIALEGGAGNGEFDRVTTLVPRYVAPEIDYQETSADPWEDSVQLALIGEAEPKEFDLPWVQHHGQARRLAKIKLAKLNPKWRFTVKLRFWGLLLLEEELVTLDFPLRGINNEPFWIDSFAFDPASEDAPVTVRLVHADPSSFDWDAVNEEGEAPKIPEDVNPEIVPVPAPIITSVTVEQRTFNEFGSGAVIVAVAAVDDSYRVVGEYRIQGSASWFPLSVDQASGQMETPILIDGATYEIRMGYSQSQLSNAAAVYSTVSDIEVSVTGATLAAPVVVSASSDGSTVTIQFSPDLGANYWRTRVYVGSSFADATLVETTYSTAETVTVTTPEITGSSYWLQSENYAQNTSAEVLAITT
jgi:hypothetical protein